MNAINDALLLPTHLYSRAEILCRPCPVPAEPGVYAWFFKEIPPGVPVDGCIVHNGLTLLYVGISPSDRKGASGKMNLRKRLQQHMNLNAEGSTLRLSLGCLLSDRLGIQLRRVGSGKRMTFGSEGEKKLNEWLEEHAFVVWVVHPQPWVLEEELIASLSLPLNLDQNAKHSFAAKLALIRQGARTAARQAPAVVGGRIIVSSYSQEE